jgi:hypothetical protein
LNEKIKEGIKEMSGSITWEHQEVCHHIRLAFEFNSNCSEDVGYGYVTYKRK